MTQRVSVKDAAREIGCSEGFLRQQMRRGDWDLGSVVRPRRGVTNFRYFIYRPKLDAMLGICRKDVESYEEEKEERR